MLIINRPSANKELVAETVAISGAAPVFVNSIFPILWDVAAYYNIDPLPTVAQSYKETGGGHFGGVISAKWFNTCGLKVRDQNIHSELQGDKPLAHAMFPSWEVGAVAHVQHLRAYANWPISRRELIVDPRYVWVMGKYTNVTHFNHLSTRWAPSRNYGAEIETIAKRWGGIA